ncbi:hypothetical protein DICVIV_13210 [Dictyocaulus viviparus]|uniref:FH2 domain-containing protein n=1 Tax=Dictyocaulus viviparus TaxID=29172 RepID=A0A0D8XAP2_DICVI|nr:hypothetical protein DICVIV_13210 [Dictyocaulus viviparus]
MEEVVPGIHLLKDAAIELQKSNALRRLFLLLVNIGNYLNSSSTHGCAAGFKLSSLWKVIDHRSTKGTSSLLHLLAKVCSISYVNIIDCMVLRLEFHRIMEEVVPGIHLLKDAAKELQKSNALRRLFLLLVNIGNYLNSSSTHGCAAGFKLSSLWKVIDHRSTKGTSSLLHLLAKMDRTLLNELEHELPSIYRASENSVEEIKTSLRSLGEKCKILGNELKVKQGIAEFEEIRQYLEDHCYIELEVTNESLMEMLKAENDLALFFCENISSFKIEECLKIFKILITRLRQAVQENEAQERRMIRKGKIKIVENEEKEPKAVEEQHEEKFFATLEKGHNLHSRRRVPASTKEQERDCYVTENINEVNTNNTVDHKEEKSTHPSNPKSMSTTLRNSDLNCEVMCLNDFVEILEKQSPMDIRRPLNRKLKTSSLKNKNDQQEEIALNIPSNSDSSTFTANSSPKSASDEGFESEKDKENSIVNLSTSPTSMRFTTNGLQNSNGGNTASTSTSQFTSQSRPLLTITASSSTMKQQKTTVAKKNINDSSAKTGQKSLTLLSQQRVKAQCKSYLPVASSLPLREHGMRSATGRSPNFITSSQMGKSGAGSVTKASVNSSYGVCNGVLQKPAKRLSSSPGVHLVTPRSTLVTLPAGTNRRMSTPQRTSHELSVQSRRTGTSFNGRLVGTAEKRDIMLKPQVSTSSRPRLIKTGSLPQSSNLPKMNSIEKPKPLRRTSEQVGNLEITGKSTMGRPKWI